MTNLFAVLLTTIKTKSAALHYESLLALVAFCEAEVGNLVHSRMQVPKLLKTVQGYQLACHLTSAKHQTSRRPNV